MTTEDTKKAQENTLRVATNLSVLLSDKDVLVPTKYAIAIVESQQLLTAFINDLKASMEGTKIIPATAAQVVAVDASI